MNYISAENVSHAIADRWLFKDLKIGILKQERIALIGRNGTGKSTLLKLFNQELQATSGRISVRNGLRVGILPQNPVFEEDKSVYENIFNVNNRLIKLVKAYEEHLLMPETSPGYLDKLHVLTEQMHHENAWAYEQQIKEVIQRLGIGALADQKMRLLSGGQRKRVAIARVLIENPDLLILDEPTNHLDLETIEWLEKLIAEKFDSLLLVSHDRYFIDAVCNQIWEIDEQTVFRYKGNYSYFLEKKEERYQVKSAEIDKAKNLMRKELEWIRRQPKARGTKAKYRVDAFYETKEKASQTQIDQRIELSIKETRVGGKIMEVRKITKKFDNKLLIRDFTYTFKREDRIGIIGKNGMGKTILLEMLTGKLLPDLGEVVTGETTKIGYYSQEDKELDPTKRVIEVVKDIAEVIELKNGAKITASQLLTRFMFPPGEQYKLVSGLSGGERKRLQLLVVLLHNPNFLILDEPTNDLDIQTLNVLEDFLEEFSGVLLLVSHDRYFMDKLVDHLFVFEGNGSISDFPGNYTDYRESKSEQKPTLSIEAPRVESRPVVIESKPKVKLSYKEQREYEQLEQDIQKLEQQKELAVQKLQTQTDHTELTRIANEIANFTQQIDEKSMRWLELGERL